MNNDKRPKILFFVTEDWYFCSHRLPLAQAALKAGFEVAVFTRIKSHRALIEAEGIRVIPLSLQRRSLNPFRELRTLLHVISVYRREHPDLVHHVAMKPVCYGSLAAMLTGIPRVVNAFGGLGYLFTSNQLLARVLRPLVVSSLRLILNKPSTRLILQNPDDFNLLVSSKTVEKKRISLIKGAGVDPGIFQFCKEPAGVITILLASRMLWDKGVGEFVETASVFRKRGLTARFILVGDSDPENPRSIPEETLQEWHQSKLVEWWGRRDDMPEVFAKAHIVCLPTTYGEGVPKVLIEAAACGRPIVTTDAPGCREIVRDGVNGFLIPAHDSNTLVEVLCKLVDDKKLREQMGAQGREIVLNEFSERQVVAETLTVYRELLNL